MRKLSFVVLTISLLSPSVARACESNSYSFNSLSREDWTEIQQVMKSSRTSIDKEATSKWDITRIIGSPHTCSKKGRVEKFIWIDREDCKKEITASFHDSELLKIRKSGF